MQFRYACRVMVFGVVISEDGHGRGEGASCLFAKKGMLAMQLRASDVLCNLRASPHLSSLALETANALLSPLGSHRDHEAGDRLVDVASEMRPGQSGSRQQRRQLRELCAAVVPMTVGWGALYLLVL